MFNIFKRNLNTKTINIVIENNQILIINGKKYLAGFSLVDDNITFHCVNKYMN